MIEFFKILTDIKSTTFTAAGFGVIFYILRWLFRDMSSVQLFGMLSDRYRKRLKSERKGGEPDGDYLELVDFELKRTSVKKIIGVSNSHIQTEIIKIIRWSTDFLDIKYFNKFNIYLSLKNQKVFLDEEKVKRRVIEASLMMVFSILPLAFSYLSFKDDPYLGLAIFILWSVFFMLSIIAFPPPKKLRKKAQNHIDSYYSEQQV
jgi:hypothetical protein